jgi:hypothetical protein
MIDRGPGLPRAASQHVTRDGAGGGFVLECHPLGDFRTDFNEFPGRRLRRFPLPHKESLQGSVQPSEIKSSSPRGRAKYQEQFAPKWQSD